MSDVGSMTTMAAERPKADPDQEVWIRNQIITAIYMGIALSKQMTVRAEELAMKSGIEGVANGAAIELLHIMRIDPCFVNLREAQ